MDALNDLGILHTDIKSDNIMFVGKSDLKVKLIDFGLALYNAEARPGMHMQPVSCRCLYPNRLLLFLHHSLQTHPTRLRTSHPLLSSSPFRSPEILLGLPFSYGIDMWGCGCVLAFLYLQNDLFKVHTAYEMASQTPEPRTQLS